MEDTSEKRPRVQREKPANTVNEPDNDGSGRRNGREGGQNARNKAKNRNNANGGGGGGGRRAERERERDVEKEPAVVIEVQRPATSARVKRRHWGLILSFLLLVVGPAAGAGYYLYTHAVDQYSSSIGFAVRTEEIGAAVEILGGISELSGSSSSDTDILYAFIQSQKLVETLDEKYDLRGTYSAPSEDPVFAFDPEGSIEDLIDYWRRMVTVYYDSGTGLIEVEVLAFQPEYAQLMAQAIYDESTELINSLSAIARSDATRYATEELERAVERLKDSRETITAYRTRNQIVDPAADIQSQMGLLGTLQVQLAEALIELDLLRENTRENDPRVRQATRRIEVIEERIEAERQKFGLSGAATSTSANYASIVAEFERLTVDREFAEQAYTAALTNYDAALSEAQRQSRYLAAYVEPTLAESAQYPRRMLLTALVTGFLFLGWSILMLVYYSIRDRR